MQVYLSILDTRLTICKNSEQNSKVVRERRPNNNLKPRKMNKRDEPKSGSRHNAGNKDQKPHLNNKKIISVYQICKKYIHITRT